MKKEVKKETTKKVTTKKKTAKKEVKLTEKQLNQKLRKQFSKTPVGKFVQFSLVVSLIMVFIGALLLVFEISLVAKGVSLVEYEMYIELGDLLIDKAWFLLLINFLAYAFMMPAMASKAKLLQTKNENGFLATFKSPAVQTFMIILIAFYIAYAFYEIGMLTLGI